MAIININGTNSMLVPVGVTSLGTVIFDNVQFPSGGYIDLEGNRVTYPSVTLDAVSLVVSRTKEIVKTPVEGLDGTIKEYVAAGDYTIDLEAIVAPDLFGLISAESVIDDIVSLGGVPEAVWIKSKYLLNEFNIQDVVIEYIRIDPHESNSYKVRMNMLSDTQADLKDFG